MIYRLWFGKHGYALREAKDENAALRKLPKKRRPLVTKIEIVRPSSKWAQ